MQHAVAHLGQSVTVRTDGTGGHTSIQAAIDAAQPNSLIEIMDNGPYREELKIGGKCEGLTLRGGRGCRPVIWSLGPTRNINNLMRVSARGVALERLVLVHSAPTGDNANGLSVWQASLRLRCVTICVEAGIPALTTSANAQVEVEDCFILGDARFLGKDLTRNSLLLKCGVDGGAQLRSCTILGEIGFGGPPGACLDSIVSSIHVPEKAFGHRVENCNLFDGSIPKVSIGCFKADPLFANPADFNYRLMPLSPCRGRASDGGDLGCRYTPEMIEMLKLALELRQPGLIKF